MKTNDKINHTTYNKDNEVVSMVVIKIVKPSGTGAMITLPKSLIGKKVEVRYVK